MPCREEIANVVHFVEQTLTAAGVKHAFQQDDENPNLWSVAAVSEDRLYMAFVAWNEEDQCVSYLGHDKVEERRREAEGFSPDMALAFVNLHNAYCLTLWLKGEVREIQAKARANRIAAEQAQMGLDSEA